MESWTRSTTPSMRFECSFACAQALSAPSVVFRTFAPCDRSWAGEGSMGRPYSPPPLPYRRKPNSIGRGGECPFTPLPSQAREDREQRIGPMEQLLASCTHKDLRRQ